jgi:hypothetical protein
MIKKFKFTNTTIKAFPDILRQSKSTGLEVSETLGQGLNCVVGKIGIKCFLFRYTFNIKKQNISLGRFGNINVANARQIAQKYRVTLAQGINPKVERDCPTRLTLDAFFNEHYLREKRGQFACFTILLINPSFSFLNWLSSRVHLQLLVIAGAVAKLIYCTEEHLSK